MASVDVGVGLFRELVDAVGPENNFAVISGFSPSLAKSASILAVYLSAYLSAFLSLFLALFLAVYLVGSDLFELQVSVPLQINIVSSKINLQLVRAGKKP